MAYIQDQQISPSKLALYLSGGVAFFAAILLSGCRLGNNVEKEEAPKNPDNLTGYYETAPKKVTFCVTSNDSSSGDAPICTDAATTRVPALIAQIMANPVAFIVDEWDQGTANIVDPYNPDQVALPVSFDKTTRALSYSGATDPSLLWKYRGCETTLTLVEKGQIVKGNGPFTSGFTEAELFGRIQMTIQVTTTIDGNCDQSLTEMQTCYSDANSCGGEDAVENNSYQSAVQSYYADFINSGAMTAEQIPSVRKLSYELQYE